MFKFFKGSIQKSHSDNAIPEEAERYIDLEIDEDGKPSIGGRPVSLTTGKTISDEEATQMRAFLHEKGLDALEFAPEAFEEMEKAGISKEDLLVALMKSVGGRQ